MSTNEVTSTKNTQVICSIYLTEIGDIKSSEPYGFVHTYVGNQCQAFMMISDRLSAVTVNGKIVKTLTSTQYRDQDYHQIYNYLIELSKIQDQLITSGLSDKFCLAVSVDNLNI